MSGVSYAIYVYGSSYTTSLDSIFIENNVINTTYYGLYPRYAKYQKVHGNTINATGTATPITICTTLYGVDVTKQHHKCRNRIWFLHLYLST